MSQQVTDVNEGERNWIGENLQIMKALVIDTLAAGPDDWLTSTNLDQVYRAWLAAHQRGVEDPNPMINAFGIAFGQLFVNVLGLEWKVVTDQYGTEIAVHGQPGDVVVFPTNLVAKRYEKNEAGFFESLFSSMKEQIQTVRGQGA